MQYTVLLICSCSVEFVVCSVQYKFVVCSVQLHKHASAAVMESGAVRPIENHDLGDSRVMMTTLGDVTKPKRWLHQ